jgi:uncharacterized membrane protein
MKKTIEFWKSNEQWILFLLLVVYLNGFWMLFFEQMQRGGVITYLFLIQFFGLAGLYSIRSNKKGWKLPKNIKDTH